MKPQRIVHVTNFGFSLVRAFLHNTGNGWRHYTEPYNSTAVAQSMLDIVRGKTGKEYAR